MTPALNTSILVTFFGALIMLLIGIIGFAVKRWLDHVDGLQVSMENLRISIIGLSSKFVTQAQHDKDIEALRAVGRRATDHCNAPECPFHAGHGV